MLTVSRLIIKSFSFFFKFFKIELFNFSSSIGFKSLFKKKLRISYVRF